jgi:ATP-dependent DNA helicase RecG
VEAGASETNNFKGHSNHLTGQLDPLSDLLNKIREAPNANYATLASVLQVSEATVKRNIQKLKQQNRIRRVGSKKTGHWEIME